MPHIALDKMPKLWYCNYTVILHILFDRGAYHNPSGLRLPKTLESPKGG